MKRNLSIFLLICMFSFITPVFAEDVNDVEAPKWEDYVPEKYYNPRDDFRRGSAISELVVGIVLTDLILTAPIGIPMICHGASKFKHVSYSDRKVNFEMGLIEAKKITDPNDKRLYYKKLLKQCKLKESQKEKLAKKRAKKAEKEAKKLEQAKKEIEEI